MMLNFGNTPIAIVGMACRLPGADSPAQFWQLLREGRCALGELPPERLNRELYYAPQRGVRGRSYTCLGGVVPLRPLRPDVWPWPAGIAERHSPFHQTICEVAAEACRHAGYAPERLPSPRGGVYLGNSSGDDLECDLAFGTCAGPLAELVERLPNIERLSPALRGAVVRRMREAMEKRAPRRATCGIADVTAGAAAKLVAETLGLTGPRQVVDAACASSFVALLLAAQALHRGQIDWAVVGSASYRNWYELVLMSQAQSISGEGSFPFDARASGLIAADGHAAVVVKTLPRALADGDRVLAVVREIGLSSDGRGKSFWAPRPEGQAAAIRRAYAGGLDSRRIQYLEAHATSTQVGDATEIMSLADALGGRLAGRVPIASVKANIGHTLETAGFASLFKTVLAMQHGMIPPAANFETPTTAIDWNASPFFVPREPLEWPEPADGGPRCAGIDSFGIGGLNTHLVIEDRPHERAGIQRVGWAPRDDQDEEPIAIIGIGSLFAGAASPEALWQLAVDEKSAITNDLSDRWDRGTSPPRPGGYLSGYEFDWKRFKVPPLQLARANPLQFLLVTAADQALGDAGYGEREFDRAQAAAIVGTVFGGDFVDETFLGVRLPEIQATLAAALRNEGAGEDAIADLTAEYGRLLLERLPAALDDTASLSSSTLASRLTKTFDLGGGAFATDAGDASALAAIAAAANLLRAGTVDLVVCAAGQRWIDQVAIETLASLDPAAVPGEGAGVLILKRLADARRDGDRVRAVIRDIGCGAEAIPLVTSEQHAAGGDERTASGPTWSRQRAVIGHTFGASGMASAVIATVGLERDSADEGTAVVRVPASDSSGNAGDWSLILERPADLRAIETPAMHSTTNNGHLVPTSPSPDDLRTLLVQLVVERNGFPPETVDFDADLEHQLQLDRSMQSDLRDELRSRLHLPADRFEQVLHHEHVATLNDLLAMTSRLIVAAEPPGDDVKEKSTVSPAADGPAVLQTASRPEVIPHERARRMRRFILRTVDRPLPAGSPPMPTFNGSVLIAGRNAAATALCERLRAADVRVHELPLSEDGDAALTAIDAIWQDGPAPHLFLMTGRAEAAALDVCDGAAWAARRSAGVLLPLLVCQRWFAHVERAGMIEQATLAAATALGGDFGLGGHGRASEGGGLAGLLKAVEVETRGRLRVRIIDAPAREPATLIVNALLSELVAETPDVEAGYLRGRRSVIRALPQPAGTLERADVPRGGVWVVTGGARGVTAAAALELARRFELRLHLLGSSPPPAIDPAWRTYSPEQFKELRTTLVREALAAGRNPQVAWGRVEKALEMDAALSAYREAGVTATYHQCDLAGRERLADVLAGIRESDGPIAGIIHGAGTETAGRFAKKRRADVERVLGAKVDGAAALMALTRDDPLRFFVAFGSTSGRFGAYINADYALANELLAKLVNRYAAERPDVRAFTVHWTAWDDVGMGARERSRFVLDHMHVTPMPALEGAAHLIDELTAASRETEILICDHPEGVHSAHPTMPPAAHWPAVCARRDGAADAPLIDAVHRDGEQGTAFLTFDPTRDPFLTGHRDDGVPLLPAVIGIESSAQAASILSGRRHVVGVRDVKLINGFRMAQPRVHRGRLRVTLQGDLAAGQLSGEFHDKQGRLTDPDRLYQSCTVELADAPRTIAAPNAGPLPTAGWIDVPYPDDWRAMEGANSGTVYYGPELRSLKAFWHDQCGAWGRISAPPLEEIGGARPGTRWHTPPSVLDAILFACDLFASYRFGTRQLPQLIEQIDVGRLPRAGEQCLTRIEYRGRDANRYSWDFWLLGDDGTVLLHGTGCHFVDLNISLADAVGRQAASPGNG